MKEFRSFTREITPNDLHSLFWLHPLHIFLSLSNFLRFPSASFVWREATWLGTRSIDFPSVPKGPIFPKVAGVVHGPEKKGSRTAETCARLLDITSFRLLHRIDRRLRPTGQHLTGDYRSDDHGSPLICQPTRCRCIIDCCSIVCDQWPTANRWITDDANTIHTARKN